MRPPFQARLAQLPVLLAGYGLDDTDAFAAAIVAEQQRTLDNVSRRGDMWATEWVQGEIEFVRMHAAAIDAAASDPMQGRG